MRPGSGGGVRRQAARDARCRRDQGRAAGGDLSRRRGPFFNDAPDINLSGLFLYLNADKKGVTLDLTDAADRARLDSLLARADILLHNVPPRERAAAGLDKQRRDAGASSG